MRKVVAGLVVLGCVAGAAAAGLAPASSLEEAAGDVLKRRCIRCHGPALSEGGLDLTRAAPRGLHGPAVMPGKPDQSLLWRKVVRGEMPPGEPLPPAERGLLRRWIVGAAARPAAPAGHWAFQPLRAPLPAVKDTRAVRTSVDRFIQARLEAVGLSLGAEADRHTLIRRVSFDLTGLPPSSEEIRAFLADSGSQAYEAMVERYLASPHYGERWGQHWLDAAGYADSNGYFNADTDRPLAYRYRDYVVRSVQQDRAWDQFMREQLAGDELAGYRAGAAIAPEKIPLLEATHFLRNSADGTDSSDGNPDEQRADKYAALEGTAQILGSSLLGVTVQCARCHDHKFEPFTQRDYYQLQAVVYPAFHIEKWVKPAQRLMEVATPAELAQWQAAVKEADGKVAALRQEFAAWAREHPEPARTLFEDAFDGPSLGERWSNTAPGDARPAGSPPVHVDGPTAPAARVESGRLHILESGAAGDRALATRAVYDWTPDLEGGWIEAMFELPAGVPAGPYVGYFVALRDFNDESAAKGGSVLLDGNAAGGAAVHVDYPGADSQGRGKIGKAGYVPGHRYGVRITRRGADRFELAQLLDEVPEEGTVTLTSRDLPDGAFGFEYCCGRSFTVDNVRIRASDPSPEAEQARDRLAAERWRRQAALEAAVKEIEKARPARPGQVAGVTDVVSDPPEVHLLERGEYKLRGPAVPAAPPAFLRDAGGPESLDTLRGTGVGTGRRLGFARWLTRPGSRPAALLARVTVNRWWQHYFGTGLARTAENLGLSGSRPSHPELLDHLAQKFMASGWSAKAIHRLILLSATYRQQSRATPLAVRRDHDNRLLSRFPLRRLDAESIRDAMLAAAGELDPRPGGPYVPTTRQADGDVVVDEASGGRRRSLYLQRRRTQVPGILEVFDAPSIVVNCTGRTSTTVPLQSLKLLNSDFIRRRAAGLAARVRREAAGEERLRLAFLLTAGRPPRPVELRTAQRFLREQPGRLGTTREPEEAAWVDLCQILLASNAFLYVE